LKKVKGGRHVGPKGVKRKRNKKEILLTERKTQEREKRKS
jgi:hypothetical protein